MTKEKALELGGKEWKGGENHRVYFNDAAILNLYGITGINVINGRARKHEKNGETFSNNKVFKLTSMQPYFDCISGELVNVDKAELI